MSSLSMVSASSRGCDYSNWRLGDVTVISAENMVYVHKKARFSVGIYRFRAKETLLKSFLDTHAIMILF